MLLDFNKCFPQAADGTQGPLPKQREFLSDSVEQSGPKYVAYVGGIGSGKTLIGCITVAVWAVLYPGDYLVCRQFAPELKVTTLKTFLEILPKELLVEYRVADGIVRIKSRGGKVSNVFFRQLEEPDKLRSMNLNGFYIDEASQVSEAAFMLLQGRLRGPFLRKGILTSNPNGHDWIYHWFVKQDMFKSEGAKRYYKLIKAPSTENVHLPDGYVQSMMDTWSEDRIRREIFGDFDSFAGQVYPEFRRDVHVIKPFAIPPEWPRIVGIDHGLRNPAAWLWAAIDYDENVYFYREFYQKEWLIEEICKGKAGLPGVIKLMGKERIEVAVIDPSTAARRGQTGFSDFDAYLEHLPAGFPLKLGNNDVKAGIDRVKTFLKVSPVTKKPQLFIFDTCSNLIEEMSQYRYKELLPNQVGKQSEKEGEVHKVNDHAADAARYLIMSRPEPAVNRDEVMKKLGYGTLEASLYADLQRLKRPMKVGDPFGD